MLDAEPQAIMRCRGEGFGGGNWNFKSSMDPEELFRTIFGDQSFRTGFGGDPSYDPFQGSTPEYKMKISFLEAAKGIEKEMTVHLMDTCPTCRGSGNQPGTSSDT